MHQECVGECSLRSESVCDTRFELDYLDEDHKVTDSGRVRFPKSPDSRSLDSHYKAVRLMYTIAEQMVR